VNDLPNFRSGYAKVNGAQLYYETAGSGFPVVFVHAGVADHRMWDEQFAVFAEHYQVIRFDLRGFGKSALVDEIYSHWSDLAGVMDGLGIERAHLIGCSRGGGTAFDFALTYPDRAASLVMVSSSPHGFEAPDLPEPEGWSEIAAAFRAGDMEKTNELETQLWAVGAGRQREDIPASVYERILDANRIVLENEIKGIGTVEEMKPSGANRMDEIRVPVLVIWGDKDVPVIPVAAASMQEKIAGARGYLIPNTAHFPNMEQPETFNRVVLEFLAGVPTG
jgi:3-oxoadipate enol-lactonase